MISIGGWLFIVAHLAWSYWRLTSFKAAGKVSLIIWLSVYWSLLLQQDFRGTVLVNLIYSSLIMFNPGGYFAAEDSDPELDFPSSVVGALVWAALGLIPYGVFQFLR